MLEPVGRARDSESDDPLNIAAPVGLASPITGRRRYVNAGEVLAAVAAVLAIADYGSGHGWWTSVWDAWAVLSGVLLAVLLIVFILVASLPWLGRAQHRYHRRPRRLLATLSVVATVLASLRSPHAIRTVVVGSAVGTAAMASWGFRWLGHRRQALGESRIGALRNGLHEWGGRIVDFPCRVVDGILDGPRGSGSHDDEDDREPRPFGIAALLAGVMVFVTMWLALVAGGWVVSVGVGSLVSVVSDGLSPEQPKPDPESRDGAAPDDHPAAPVHPTAPPKVAGGSLHCSRPVGHGFDIPKDLVAAVAQRLPELAQPFHLCANQTLAWNPTTGVYEQPLYTDDGDGAVLIAWDLDGAWIVTFVSSDDGAAYRIVSPTLDWGVLGRPHPFRQCDGLWLQLLEGRDGELVGVGIRDRVDAEGHWDRPVFAWGATIEVLLDGPGGTLLLPAGDTNGSLQYFFGRRQPVGAPRTSADILVAADLVAHCDW